MHFLKSVFDGMDKEKVTWMTRIEAFLNELT